MERRLFELILSVKRKCQANEDKIQNELELTPGEFNGLLSLFPGDRIAGGELSTRMGLSASRGSRVLTNMMKKGFVDTEIDPENRRTIFVSLTPVGQEMKKRIEARMETCETRICSHFEECQIDQIKDSLLMLEEAL